MPNTLAHLGGQTLVTRAFVRGAAVRWIFLGAVIPDLPWILGRALGVIAPPLLDHDAWAYLIAQSTLSMSLVLCGAIALLTVHPGRVFGILALNAVAHLLLDGLQLKWGNGVHLFAPITWSHWNAGWFAVESWPTYLLTALGFGIGLWSIGRATPERFFVSKGPRVALACGLAMLYLAIPIPLRQGPKAADTNSVGTLADRENRAGQVVRFDRVAYLAREDGHYLRTYVGEEIALESRWLDQTGTVSARATFVTDSTLEVHELHDHSGWPRDLMNYLGLGFVLAVWVVPMFRRRAPSPRAVATNRGG